MSTPRSSREGHEWVQPILVSKTGSHADTVRAAAQASIAVWSKPKTEAYPVENYVQWLAGPFTKTVRRASEAQLSGTIQFWAKEVAIPYAAVRVGSSVAVAFSPMRYSDMPKQIAKHQVSGTDFERTPGVPNPPDSPVVAIVDEALSTGKAAAAAAHAVWAWALPREHSEDEPTLAMLDRWQHHGFPVTVTFAPATDLAAIARERETHPIVDAGLTEVEANTLTAVGASVVIRHR